MIARLFEAVLGIWLMVAPAVLGYGSVAATSDRIAGPLIASVAIVAAWEIARPLRHLNLLLGLWLLAAPVVLGFGGAAAVDSVLVGIAVAALSRWRGRVESRFGGGWSVLWPPSWARGEEQRELFAAEGRDDGRRQG
ncbi:MAG TPA: SPW repeat protein [Trueperaceae bacterium]